MSDRFICVTQMTYHVKDVVQATDPLALICIETSDPEDCRRILKFGQSSHNSGSDREEWNIHIVTPAIPTHS